jgi:amino-acid N-acetyltransferase
MSDVRIDDATPADLPAVRALLESLELPAEDVGAPNQSFLIARDGGDLAGCVGLERHGDAVLLRSLAVPAARQGRGLGRALHGRALGVARATGVREVYLLTTTAEGFFAREGYARVDRSAVPLPVRDSPEFRTLCPATAVCMALKLR